jgi:hypothetical protein
VTRTNRRPNAIRPTAQALSVTVAGQVVDTFVTLAKRNTYLQALLSGPTKQYRRALVWGLLAITGRPAAAQASVLLAAAHRSMSISASDFELLKYYLLAATERHRLALELRLRIAAALASAGVTTVARSPAIPAIPATLTTRRPSVLPRNRGHWT